MSELKGVKNVTPVGELHWVNISGQGKRNYNDDGYIYTATIYLEGEAAAAERKKIEDVLGPVPKGANVKSLGFRNLVKDKEGNLHTPNKDGEVNVENEDGETVDIASECEETDIWAFTYSTKTEFEDGKTKEIGVHNKDGKKISMGDKLIGNGSFGALSGKLKRFAKGKDIGVSLFLHAVQLTKFVPYEGGAGFGAQEGEFEGVSDEETGFTGQPDDAKESTAKATAKAKTKPKL